MAFAAIAFVSLLLIGIPIAFVVGLVSMGLMFDAGGARFMLLVPQRVFAGLNVFTIMAIPFFFLAAELMTASRAIEDIVKFADALVGRLRGGLAHVNIMASALFSTMSGSALADIATLGSIEIRAMETMGYDRRFATALTVASSIVGAIIPPSIILMLYASVAQVSVAAIFLASIVPGALLIGLLMMLVVLLARKYDFPRRERRYSAKEFMTISVDAALPLAMPVIILGGILSGVFTATEAAAVAVAYILVIGLFVKRTLKPSDIPGCMLRAGVMTSVIFMVLATANVFGWFIGLERIPENIAKSLIGVASDPVVLLLLIVGVLLLVGMFMDSGAALIVMAPILAPVAVSGGIHPIHFGIVMALTLVVGLTTPPVGPCLFAAASVSKLRIETISFAMLPFYAIQVVFLLMLVLVPEISLALPRMAGFIN
ncbi:TRAP transporter large permease [Martelella mediterranea]|uniref:TRAP transporter large permease n=1 Tax=Martelella mediterranea TaxID=293089 RepID=UPI001E284F44|nr:TRAP transporter large permease [Martelella mediterranea]MCD1636815.1 TRAP transporter large permease [Martelella mediterranea]